MLNENPTVCRIQGRSVGSSRLETKIKSSLPSRPRRGAGVVPANYSGNLLENSSFVFLVVMSENAAFPRLEGRAVSAPHDTQQGGKRDVLPKRRTMPIERSEVEVTFHTGWTV